MRLPASWQARLVALPGVLTVLSVLAVMWGGHASGPEVQTRPATATSIAPSLPEWRTAPQPAPAVPLPGAPPPEPLRLTTLPRYDAPLLRFSSAPRLRPELTWWGRQQTDGG